MSIIVKLDDMLHERRMTLTELSERIGITLANLSVLKTGKARAIRFSTLDAICAALQCQPGDLLELAQHPSILIYLPQAVNANDGSQRQSPGRTPVE